MLQVDVCVLRFCLVSRRCHIISTIHQLALAPLRTVLALFTHTAPHIVSLHDHPAFSAVRCSFVSTDSPLLRAEGVSSHRATMCSFLPSSSITRLLWYSEAIRLPVSHLPSSLFSCPAYSLCYERDTGPPGLPCNHNVKHAMVSDPEEAGITLPLAAIPVLTSTSLTVSSFPTRQLRGSIPSSFRLTACLLAVLRLKPDVTTRPPRTRYPVAGRPSGAGFPPAELHDLARPHKRTVPFNPYR